MQKHLFQKYKINLSNKHKIKLLKFRINSHKKINIKKSIKKKRKAQKMNISIKNNPNNLKKLK